MISVNWLPFQLGGPSLLEREGKPLEHTEEYLSARKAFFTELGISYQDVLRRIEDELWPELLTEPLLSSGQGRLSRL